MNWLAPLSLCLPFADNAIENRKLGKQNMPHRLRQAGYTLVELLVALIILAIISAVAVRSLQETVVVSRTEETKSEMESLAHAIAGNPALISNGVRTDYGYIGDVGALPPTIGALSVNPGSYATWRGPYLQDNLAASVGAASVSMASSDGGLMNESTTTWSVWALSSVIRDSVAATAASAAAARTSAAACCAP